MLRSVEGSPGGLALRLRNEASPQELRAVITPDDARRLVDAGVTLTVEESPQRIFPTAEYAAAGARIAPADSWGEAPTDEIVVGLKAPGPLPSALRHRHVFFGHAYKGQQGGEALLRRFVEGGGALLDLEYLTDDTGRRVAAFGYWAGYVGAALAALHVRGDLTPPLRATSRADLDLALGKGAGDPVRALVIGALGRSGQGAVAALSVAGMAVTAWDIAQTRQLDRAALLDHDILVNTVLTQVPAPPFVRPEDLDDPSRRLAVISDVTCDVTSECNLLPIYDRPTDWAQPVRRFSGTASPLDLIAIDNLPSMLPREASTAFSADLLPHLLALAEGSPVWQRAYDRFVAASTALHEGLGRTS
ncbi:saccharopine dehydrogenase [Micromonospora sp. CP22]|uniref:saccharopine dehydrogenase n=1 Tax=Micromonospora sp. CP22 TaxID=2580517 RepID=UPI0028156814|nr:saccharopine dehydrogenase [Micromonospora sp. CP22]